MKKRKDFLENTGPIPLKKPKQTEANLNISKPATDRENYRQVPVISMIDPAALVPFKSLLIRAYYDFDGTFCSVPHELDATTDRVYFGLDCEFVQYANDPKSYAAIVGLVDFSGQPLMENVKVRKTGC